MWLAVRRSSPPKKVLTTPLTLAPLQVKLTATLQAGVDRIKDTAKRVAEAQLDEGMSTPVDEYLRTLHFGLAEVVYAWARGIPFKDITELTDVQEGAIVRCIVRLDETCRDIRNAARVIGIVHTHARRVRARIPLLRRCL